MNQSHHYCNFHTRQGMKISRTELTVVTALRHNIQRIQRTGNDSTAALALVPLCPSASHTLVHSVTLWGQVDINSPAFLGFLFFFFLWGEYFSIFMSKSFCLLINS